MKLTNKNDATSVEYCKAFRVTPQKVPTPTYKGSGDPIYWDYGRNPDLVPEVTDVWITKEEMDNKRGK